MNLDWTSWNSVVEEKVTEGRTDFAGKQRHQKLDLHEALLRWRHQKCENLRDKV